jgi:hypothetical protein
MNEETRCELGKGVAVDINPDGYFRVFYIDTEHGAILLNDTEKKALKAYLNKA